MLRFSSVIWSGLFLALPLIGGELSREKIVLINSVCYTEYSPIGQKGKGNANDPKIKARIISTLKKKLKPYKAKGKLIGISKKDNQEINKIMQKAFPYRTPEEIAKGAIERSERVVPLYEPGQKVRVEFVQHREYKVLEGKYEKINNLHFVNGTPVPLDALNKKQRSRFDADLNRQRRAKYRDFYTSKYQVLKKKRYNELRAKALVSLEQNEKNGYIFFRGAWRQPEYVVNFFISYHQKRAALRQKNMSR